MTDSVDKLASGVGLSRETILAIAAKAKQNQSALEGCVRHEFVAISNDSPLVLSRRYRCAHCGGEVDGHAYHWYQRGMRHAAA